jgi:ribosomal protein L16 Arg81 hydroxylase
MQDIDDMFRDKVNLLRDEFGLIPAKRMAKDMMISHYMDKAVAYGDHRDRLDYIIKVVYIMNMKD